MVTTYIFKSNTSCDKSTTISLFFSLSLSQDLAMFLWLTLGSPRWPPTHRNPPALNSVCYNYRYAPPCPSPSVIFCMCDAPKNNLECHSSGTCTYLLYVCARFLHWPGTWQVVQDGWLVSEPQRSVCLHFPITGILNHHIWLFFSQVDSGKPTYVLLIAILD